MKPFQMLSLAAALTLSTTLVPARAEEPIKPIAPAVVKDAKLVELGKKLFFDPRLSKSGSASCNSCHNVSKGGAENRKMSIGHSWQKDPVNAPTVLNASLTSVQTWDGRTIIPKDPAGNSGDTAFTHDLAIEAVKAIPGYASEFKSAFGNDTIDVDNATKAIAAFQETLVTPNSRFDKWLNGDNRALTADELSGYEVFKDLGCTECHNGSAAGGNTFKKMGLVEPYKSTSLAEGRAAFTKEEADRFKFKVPTLRNVDLTSPYFHDGEAKTLFEAVEVMSRVQLGKKLPKSLNEMIVAFLKTLTGDQPNIEAPVLPPSKDGTVPPKPAQ